MTAVTNTTRSPAAALFAVLLFVLVASGVSAQDEPMHFMPLVVADGTISVGGLTATVCVPVPGLTLEGMTFTVHTSHWQRRAAADAPWEDIAGTEVMGQVCPYSPEQPGDYRMIIDGTIDGERGLYRSNVFTKTDVPALPGIAAVWLGLLLAGLLARARRRATTGS